MLSFLTGSLPGSRMREGEGEGVLIVGKKWVKMVVSRHKKMI